MLLQSLKKGQTMKRTAWLLLINLIFCADHCSSSGCSSNERSTSRTFMFTRPVYHNLPALEQRWYLLHASDRGEQAGVFNVTGLFQQTVQNSKIASYFLLDCKDSLLIAGDDTSDASQRDVRAEWLGLSSDFQGILSLHPWQRQAGVVLSYDQGFHSCSSWPFLRNLRWGLRMPIITVTNNIHPCQLLIATINQENLLTAFNQPAWCFAKLSTENLSRTGVPELIGYLSNVWLDDDNFFLASSLGIGIPTAKKQHPDFLFNTFLGPNGHLNFIINVLAELPLTTCAEDRTFLIRFIIEDRFYYPNHQLRTLDLKHKQWSRYLMLRREGEQETVPAMNVLTQCVKVSPQSVIELQAGLVYRHHAFTFEVGYDLWGRHHERIKLMHPCCEKTPPLIAQFGISGTGTNSASASTISFQAPNDPTFVYLNENDLDFCGNGSAGGIVNRFYVLGNYTIKRKRAEVLLSLGGFFEAPQKNIALKQAGAWGTIAIGF
jgi:hypothetical protein